MMTMNRRLSSTLIPLIAAVSVAACERGARGERGATGSPSAAIEASPQASPATPETKIYDIRGTVVAVAPDSGTVNLDHEEIPGFMAAMKMEYQVQEAGMLSGLKPGDRVAGRLQARGDEYLIVALEKQPRR